MSTVWIFTFGRHSWLMKLALAEVTLPRAVVIVGFDTVKPLLRRTISPSCTASAAESQHDARSKASWTGFASFLLSAIAPDA